MDYGTTMTNAAVNHADTVTQFTRAEQPLHLCRALLSRKSVRILVTLPHNVVKVLHIRTEDFPVKPSILELDFALHVTAELLCLCLCLSFSLTRWWDQTKTVVILIVQPPYVEAEVTPNPGG